MMAQAGLPQVRYEAVTQAEWRADRDAVLDARAAIGLPCFVKPARLGSSVGISKVDEREQLAAALEAGVRARPAACWSRRRRSERRSSAR